LAAASLWSALLSFCAYRVVDANSHCFVIVNAPSRVWFLFGLIWCWLLLFLLFESNRGRLTLTASTLVLAFLLPHADSIPAAAGEASAVIRLRALVAALERFRKEHPLEGYPQRLPNVPTTNFGARLEILYTVDFSTARSKPEGPIDQFLIQFTPVWRECGYVRSFAATEDDQVRFTMECRRATKTDDALQ